MPQNDPGEAVTRPPREETESTGRLLLCGWPAELTAFPVEDQCFLKKEWADAVVGQSHAFGRCFLKERSKTVSSRTNDSVESSSKN